MLKNEKKIATLTVEELVRKIQHVIGKNHFNMSHIAKHRRDLIDLFNQMEERTSELAS